MKTMVKSQLGFGHVGHVFDRRMLSKVTRSIGETGRLQMRQCIWSVAQSLHDAVSRKLDER